MKKILILIAFVAVSGVILSNCKKEEPCEEKAWYQDADHDGLGNPDEVLFVCEQPQGYVADSTDADDTCIESTFYEDADNDGLGNPDVRIDTCFV